MIYKRIRKRERTCIIYVRDKCENKDCSWKLALQQHDMSTYANGSPSVANTFNKRTTTTTAAAMQSRYTYTSWETSVSRRETDVKGGIKREQWKSGRDFCNSLPLSKIATHRIAYPDRPSRITLSTGRGREREGDIRKNGTIIEGQMLNALAKCCKCTVANL